METWLVAGLGNPEGKYFQTYHNVGFLTADKLAAKFDLVFKKKGNQLLAEQKLENGDKVIILKPLTYMNLSGQAVVAAVRKNKIETPRIIVFTDDLHIDRGKIRISFGGSSAGHNGIKSVTELLQTDQYIKIRIGIMPTEPQKSGTADYVLSKIDETARPLIDEAIKKAADAALLLINGETLAKVQNLYNTCNNVQNPK